MKPTLEQVLKYFKDAEIVECLSSLRNYDISENIEKEIHEYVSEYWVNIKNHRVSNVLIWDKEEGYAKIIKLKTKTMKKVILEEKKSDVYLSDLNEGSNIGIHWSSGEKGFILHSREKGFYSYGSISKFDLEDKVFEPTIKKYINNNKGITEVFVFDTAKDLFKWMSE
jgi:hypothetical protein